MSTLSPASKRLTSSVWPTSKAVASSTTELAHVAHAGQALELAQPGLGQRAWRCPRRPGRRCSRRARACAAAVTVLGFDGHHGDRHHRAVLREDLGHADLAAEDSDAWLAHILISMSTPAASAESHQGVDRLGRGVEDVDEPLVGADLELLPAVLVDERRTQDGELLDTRRQRHRADDVRAGALGRLHDLERRLVQQPVVVCLEADPDPLPCHQAQDLGDGAGAHGVATFADGEALGRLEGDGGDELDVHLDVVAGDDHLGATVELDGPGDVGGAQVELRAGSRCRRGYGGRPPPWSGRTPGP